MEPNSSQAIPDLGIYSIRRPEEYEIPVGAFWKRLRNDQNDDASEDDKPRSKRAAIVPSNTETVRSCRASSLVSQSTAFDSQFTISSAADISENISVYSNQENDQAPPAGSSEQEEIVNRNQQVGGRHNQTNAFESSFSQQSKSLFGDDDTHVTVVVSINPAELETTGDESQPNNLSGPDGNQTLSLRVLRRKVKKIYPKHKPYNQILMGVTFVMSGYENPRRSKLRDLALSMGAKYSPKWSRQCTHLICAFKNTPKFKEVMAENGKVVREHWIQECSRRKCLLDWRDFKLGKYNYPDSEEEIEDDDLDYALERGYGCEESSTST